MLSADVLGAESDFSYFSKDDYVLMMRAVTVTVGFSIKRKAFLQYVDVNWGTSKVYMQKFSFN